MADDGEREFYQRHRGGSGAVVLAIAISNRGDGQMFAVFSNLEAAEKWREYLPDDYACIYAPYIVDDPDWGNEAFHVT